MAVFQTSMWVLYPSFLSKSDCPGSLWTKGKGLHEPPFCATLNCAPNVRANGHPELTKIAWRCEVADYDIARVPAPDKRNLYLRGTTWWMAA